MKVITAHKRVLLVDDDQTLLKLLKAVVGSGGYQVYAESDSTVVLQVFQKYRPHLAIIDLAMPEVNGIELAYQLKNSEFKNIPLFALTGKPLLNEKNSIFFKHVFYKPFNSQELLTTVCDALN